MKMWLKIVLVLLVLLVGTLGGWSALGQEPEALEFDPDAGWASVHDITPDGGWSSVHDFDPDGGWFAI